VTPAGGIRPLTSPPPGVFGLWVGKLLPRDFETPVKSVRLSRRQSSTSLSRCDTG
jgi:hypothetical protein